MNYLGNASLFKHNLDGQIERLHDIRKQTFSLNTNYHQFTAYLFSRGKTIAA